MRKGECGRWGLRHGGSVEDGQPPPLPGQWTGRDMFAADVNAVHSARISSLPRTPHRWGHPLPEHDWGRPPPAGRQWVPSSCLPHWPPLAPYPSPRAPDWWAWRNRGDLPHPAMSLGTVGRGHPPLRRFPARRPATRLHPRPVDDGPSRRRTGGGRGWERGGGHPRTHAATAAGDRGCLRARTLPAVVPPPHPHLSPGPPSPVLFRPPSPPSSSPREGSHDNLPPP